jgi:ADP-ribosyl-[dinitrogen reductase] hydrolase
MRFKRALKNGAGSRKRAVLRGRRRRARRSTSAGLGRNVCTNDDVTPRLIRMTRDELRGLYRGTLLGVAVGNALGVELEGLSPRAITDRFAHRLRDISPRERDLPWDDDVAQTVILAEALLQEAPLDPDDLETRLVRWAKENGRGMGMLTAQVLGRMQLLGIPARDAAREAWEASGRQAAGNGAVMRCPPVALRWRLDPRRLVEETLASAAATHADPRCGWTAVAVNVAIRNILAGREVDLEALAGSVEEAPDEVRRAIMEMNEARLEDLDLHGPAMGYTVKAMQVGLWSARTEQGFEESLVTVVSVGGDTDTNGAIAGAVLGARFGIDAIPRRWLDSIRGADQLVELADALLTASEAGPR